MPATSRLIVDAVPPELVGRSFSIVVDATRRSRRAGDVLREHARPARSPAATSPPAAPGAGDHWFLAEGATGAYFDTYILVGNPNATPATVTLTFLIDDGATVIRTKTVAANARLTVNVEADDPLLANTAVSTTVTSDMPVVSERAMYWPGSRSVLD